VESPRSEFAQADPFYPPVPPPGTPSQPQSEDWYHILLKHSLDLLCTHDLEGTLLSASTAAATLLGYSVEELLRIPMPELIDPIFRSQFDSYLTEIQRAGEAHGLLAVMTRSGERRIWEYHNKLQIEGVSTPIVLGLAHDVTEQRLAQTLLQASEQRFRAVYDKSAIGFSLVDPRDGRILQVNRKYCEITGRSEEELKRLNISSVTHPDDVAMTTERLRELAQGRTEPFEVEKRYVRPDGSVRWANLLVVPMWAEGKTPSCVMSVLQDITDRKHAEEALQQSEAHLRHAQAVAHMGSWRYDIAGNALTLSDELYRIIGLPAGTAIVPEQAMEFLASEDHERIVRAWTAALESGHFDQECRVLVNGENRLVHVQACVGCDAHGSRVGAVGTVQDITEQKEAEEALLQSEARYRKLFADSIAGVAISTLEGELIDCNDTWARMLGYTSAEQVRGQRTVQNYAEPSQRQVFVDKLKREGTLFNQEMQLRRRDGTLLWALTNATLLPASHHGPLMQTTFTDITERKQAEDALRQQAFLLSDSQRVAHIGSWSWEVGAERIQWSEETYSIYGVDPATFDPTPENFLGLLHPEDRPLMQEWIRATLAGEPTGELEFRIILGDGSVRILSGRGGLQGASSQAPARMVGTVQDITERKRLEEELRQAKEKLAEEKLYLEEEIKAELGVDEIIGRSKVLRDVMEQVAIVAGSDAAVLLLGETGTGKELVARALHLHSQRQGYAFIKMNCAAIPSGLLESELFGYEKGAFTGAAGRKAGRLELADGGTLFLDEISEIPLALQPKLLRVLQDREFERLGGTRTLKSNFRLIAATNRDLLQSVTQGQFRKDLYYRVNVFPIRLPSLRERREDIPLLVEHFVRRFARRLNKSITSIPQKTMQSLTRWNWPGNIRELENFIERSVILSRGSVLACPVSELFPDAEAKPNDTLETIERKHIVNALRESGGQLSGPHGAAARLGLKRTTLQSKLKQFGIDAREFREDRRNSA